MTRAWRALRRDVVTTFALRPIRAEDDAAIAAIIRAVMPEFGAVGEGFAINDPEVDFMSRAYSTPRAAYFVVERQEREGRDEGERRVVVGGGGIAPLVGGDGETCELRKMYFLRESRGHGVGERLLTKCIEAARDFGYARCYLETLTGMDSAQRLYVKMGFEKLCGPLGATGHGGCDRFFVRALRS